MSPNMIASECENTSAPDHNGSPTYCSACEIVYCDSCYDSQILHRRGRNRNNEHHEKTDLGTANFVLSLFDTKSTQERECQHEDNLRTKWFGTSIDETESTSYFHDFGSFRRLLHDSKHPTNKQYPSLISFVGQTGSGKSTLINGILKLPEQITARSPTDILSPVMGASYEQSNSTSGDVHVFSDPSTCDSHFPIFYADCEGIDGTDVPTAAKCLMELKSTNSLAEIIYKKRIISPPITRRWAVRELYPRILFPFSDVICYVTTNPRTFEHHVETLLLWANKAIDKTTNQPMLPHLILVINIFSVKDAPEDYFDDWWDIGKVTSHFLDTRRGLVDISSSKIGCLASYWTQRGRDIKSLEDLIRCYYSDFKIICIPNTDSYQHSRIIAQYRLLQKAIKSASESCRKLRRGLGFLMSSEKLERYVEMAFDHFTSTPDKAFNFLSAALFHKPVTQSLKDHICKLAVRYMNFDLTKGGVKIFQDLAVWVASCIFLDSHRCDLPGKDVAETIFRQYEVFFREGQKKFYDTHWPCEAIDKKGDRCVNIRSTHTPKGHQNVAGKIFHANDHQFKLVFKSSFESDASKQDANEICSNMILKELQRCIQEYKVLVDLKKPYDDDTKKIPAKIHMNNLENFRIHGFIKDLVSYQTCFCCLVSSPAHKLFCGHAICQFCLEDYSKEEKEPLFCRVIKACPLCANSAGPPDPGEGLVAMKFEMKPPTAGVRVLCLDGGGVRSIMQLEILKQLESAIGLGIPIHRFFDLIVGTSGGGIVAAGMGLRYPTIDACIVMFKSVVRKAFKKRRGCDIKIFGKVLVAHHQSLYETTGIENVLKDVFRDRPIFGATTGTVMPCGTISGLKVAVTATSSSWRTFLLSNYNRPPPEGKVTGYAGLWDEEGAQEEVEVQGEEGQKDEKQTKSKERLKEVGLEESDEESDGRVDDEDEDVESLARSSEETIDDSRSSSDESYNERSDTRSSYMFFRGEDEKTELKLWEAVRATSAAPGYFKSYIHPATKVIFDDGALRCNNPVFVADKERKILWPESSGQDLDILLSIGTGYDPNPLPEPQEVIPRHGIQGFIQKVIKLGREAILEDMNCETLWQEFIEGFGTDERANERRGRYQRLNPPLRPPPALDGVDKVDNLQQEAQKFMYKSLNVKEIANSLTGALFYFEFHAVSTSHRDNESGNHGHHLEPRLDCKGEIKCRLGPSVLGQILTSCSSSRRENIFLIGRTGEERTRLEVNRSTSTSGTSYDVTFRLEHRDKDKLVCIFFSRESDPTRTVRISGFPRLLYGEAHALCTREYSQTQ